MDKGNIQFHEKNVYKDKKNHTHTKTTIIYLIMNSL